MIKNRIFFALLLFMVGVSCSLSVNAETLRERLMTVAGELKIVQLDEGELGNQYAVILDGNVILKTDFDDEYGRFTGFPIPRMFKKFKNGIRPYDEVILFQQGMWGNACDGGPLWFLGLNKNGSFSMSANIDFCGGDAPIVRQKGDAITLIFSGETWVYQKGEARQIRRSNKKR